MAQLEPIVLDRRPQTVLEFRGLQERFARKPEGGAAAFVTALWMFCLDRSLGEECLLLTVDADRIEQVIGTHGKQLQQMFRLRIEEQLATQPYLIRSYFVGATPQNGYQPSDPYTITCLDNPFSIDSTGLRIKLFLVCGGADSPRPITLRRGWDDFWRALEWSSVVMGIKPLQPSP